MKYVVKLGEVAKTWRVFDIKTGNLSAQDVQLQPGAVVDAFEVGTSSAGKTVLKFSNGVYPLYTLKNWFAVAPTEPIPDPDPVPLPTTPFTLSVDGYQPFSGSLTPL